MASRVLFTTPPRATFEGRHRDLRSIFRSISWLGQELIIVAYKVGGK